MADGKHPTEAGKYTYDKKLFFLNRAPRFYHTFAFPGIERSLVGGKVEAVAGYVVIGGFPCDEVSTAVSIHMHT